MTAKQYLIEHDVWEYYVQVNGNREVTPERVQALIDYYCNEDFGDLYEHRKDVVSAYEQHFDMGYNLGVLKTLAEAEVNNKSIDN